MDHDETFHVRRPCSPTGQQRRKGVDDTVVWCGQLEAGRGFALIEHACGQLLVDLIDPDPLPRQPRQRG